MLSPPLDVPTLLAMFVASEFEAQTKVRGEQMHAAEALQMELWRQRRALIAFITSHMPAPPSAAAGDRDQPELPI